MLDGDETTGILNTEAAYILPPYSLSQSNYDAGAPAEFAITFTPTNAIPTEGSIQLSWPPQVAVDADTQCYVITNRVFSSNCIIEPAPGDSTDQQEAGGTVTIAGVFVDQEQFDNEITIKLGVSNPVNNLPATLGFGIRTYADENSSYMIDYVSDTNEYLIPHLECIHPCATCAATDETLCESCW